MKGITEMQKKPCNVEIDKLPDGGLWVKLRKNIESVNIQTEEQAQTMFRADEVAFRLPAGRIDSTESIAEEFDAWWAYGESWTEATECAPTLEERVANIEAFAAMAIEMGVLG